MAQSLRSVDSVKETKLNPAQNDSPLTSNANSAGPSLTPRTPNSLGRIDRDKKIGHRRVDDAGQVTYKKKPTSELMAAIQLGIGQSVGALSPKPHRDLLLQDFSVVESTFYPREGSNLTPAHHYSDFRFKTYAPVAFRYFRELFGIQPDDFLLSLCNEPLRELSNPGASGSIFYITNDDEFIIKTVQHKEAEFLQKLLPGYYMNLNQNPRTLLPKFYGLYCYQCGGKNIRFTVMNNLLPTQVRIHEKYDLKGSTYKRKASRHERAKGSPTLKDLDFMEVNPDGIMLESETFGALQRTIERDCMVLQSFKIMDYSMLLGVHNLDSNSKEKQQQQQQHQQEDEPGTTNSSNPASGMAPESSDSTAIATSSNRVSFSRGRSMKQRLAVFSTAMEAIQASSEPVQLESEDVPPGIPARNARGDRLILYAGIIDILQSYRLKKKLEHAMKAMVHDGDAISVHRPGFYSARFQEFFVSSVFRKIPSPLKHSPSKKKSFSGRSRSIPTWDTESRTPDKHDNETRPRTANLKDSGSVLGATGERPDLLPGNTSFRSPHSTSSARPRVGLNSQSFHSPLEKSEIESSKDLSDPLDFPHSVADSTPTHTDYTEGTPSYTISSLSCSSEIIDSALVTVKATKMHSVISSSADAVSSDQVDIKLEENNTMSAESDNQSSEQLNNTFEM